MPAPVSSYGVPRTSTPSLIGWFDQFIPPRGVQITGITRDSSGNALGNCTVQVFETLTGLFRSQTTSDSTGYFAVNVNNDRPFFLVAYLPGLPDVAGTTVDNLISPAFIAITNTYDGTAGNETVPFGASSLIVECWSAGGGGEGPFSGNLYGGGSGAYCKKTIAITPYDWGLSIPYSSSVGGTGGDAIGAPTAGFPSSVGSLSMTASALNLAAIGGNVSNGAAATASGGDTNTSGSVTGGVNGASAPNGGAGGSGGGSTGSIGSAPGGGGGAGTSQGALGASGRIKFAWT